MYSVVITDSLTGEMRLWCERRLTEKEAEMIRSFSARHFHHKVEIVPYEECAQIRWRISRWNNRWQFKLRGAELRTKAATV